MNRMPAKHSLYRTFSIVPGSVHVIALRLLYMKSLGVKRSKVLEERLRRDPIGNQTRKKVRMMRGIVRVNQMGRTKTTQSRY
jgi:hypothetical protein